MSVKLGNLVYDWIQNNPELKPHFNISLFGDGFYIETKCGGHFTIAWVDGDAGVKTSPNTWINQTAEKISLDPADPEYFNKLEELCRNWHNSYSKYTYGCKTKL